MSQATVRGGFDTYASSAHPSRENYGAKYLRLQTAASRAFVYFRNPAPPGATITSATLTVYARGDSLGPRTLTAARVSDSWKARQLNWNNAPGVVGTTDVTTTIGDLVDGDPIEFDVTSHVQTIANGAANYGWRIVTSDSNVHKLYGLDSGDLKPFLTVEWSDAPSAPTSLSPGDGGVVSISKPTLQFDYTDLSGETTLAAVHVQIDPGQNGTTPLFDSGTVLVEEPELDLTTTAYAGLSNGATTSWRVKVQDEGGLWSDWSEWASFSRDNKLTLTLDNPSATAISATNRALDPSAESGVTNSQVTGGAANYPIDYDTTTFYVGTRSVHTTRTTASPSVNISVVNFSATAITTPTIIPVTPGETISASVRARCDRVDWRGRLTFVFRDAAGTQLSTAAGPLLTGIPTNEWILVTNENVTVPAGAAFVTAQTSALMPAGENTVGGEQAWFDALMLNSGATVKPYFDGDTPDSGATIYEWTGTPHQSTSTKATAYVEENTPPILWSPSGGTQAAWRVRIADADDHAKIKYDSAKRNGTATSHTLPKGILKDNRDYAVNVRVWDDVEGREATPGDPVYTEVWRDFLVNDDPSTDPIDADSLVASQQGVTPWVRLDWTRATAPDSWTIIRDGVVIDADVEVEDTTTTGTAHTWTDYTAAPNTEHTYEVRAIVNGKRSGTGSTSGSVTTSPNGIWILDKDRGINVTLWGDDEGSWDMPDDAETYRPLGSDETVRIVSGMGGLEGNLQGFLMEGFGKTFAAMEADFYRIKERPTQTVRIIAADMNFRALIGNVRISPKPITREGMVVKAVSFDFWQTGELPFDPRL